MPNNIVVVGAGVSGLTTAMLLSEDKNNTVTIVAKHMPGDYDIEYASPFAGANVLPMSEEKDSEWERKTWPVLKRICETTPEAGIHFQKTLAYRREKDLSPSSPDPLFSHNPWFQHLLPNYRELDTHEVPEGFDSGCTFDSLCINTALYLQWLMGQCLKNGVVAKRGILSHIREAKHLSHTSAPASIIINTTGLGSLKLGGVEDKSMAPYRGQTVLVRNEFTPMVATSGTDDSPADMMYIMQRAAGGGTILGGTYDKNNWESAPDPNVANRIMERAVKLCPEIAGGKGVSGLSVIRHVVGLRPYREGGVRVEHEKLDADTEIVHNYGHAGWGYQGSYATAQRVVELVKSVGAAKTEL